LHKKKNPSVHDITVCFFFYLIFFWK
jgi:hypothetical protein